MNANSIQNCSLIVCFNNFLQSWEGLLYLAIELELFHRKFITWTMGGVVEPQTVSD